MNALSPWLLNINAALNQPGLAVIFEKQDGGYHYKIVNPIKATKYVMSQSSPPLKRSSITRSLRTAHSAPWSVRWVIAKRKACWNEILTEEKNAGNLLTQVAGNYMNEAAAAETE